MSTIQLQSVVKSFGATPVLRDVDLTVDDGSLTAILGESGSGKTTMLRVIAGFERVDSGSVFINGRLVDDGHRSVHAQARGVGYVPQEGALFPHLNVHRNIAFGLAKADRGKVDGLMELVGLGGLGRRYPHQLSGGQQQRVALARALAIEPKVVLLDEPFSSLDATLRADLRRDVMSILERTGTTTILVTHDQDEAMSLADKITVLRAGRVMASETPRRLYMDPPNAAAAAYIGEANIVDAAVVSGVLASPVGPVELIGGRPSADGPVQLMLRPEQLIIDSLGESPGAVGASVVDVRYHGHDALVTLAIAGSGAPLVARVPGDQQLEAGSRVGLRIQGLVRVWPA